MRWKIMCKRIGEIKRDTNETNINMEINLDGNGTNKIETNIGFFNHMLMLFLFIVVLI